jgi:cytoskeletal protein CcmA (bactofilin family)
MKLFRVRPTKQAATSFSLVDDRLTVRGDIDTDGTIRVDGRIEGRTHRAGTIIVGAGGSVAGDIDAREIIVAGDIQGNVIARGRIEIEAGAVVRGEIRANAMSLHEGGAVDGPVHIGLEAPPAPVPTRHLELAAAPTATGRGRA